MFLLDTNVISELRIITRADRSVVNWFETPDQSSFFLSAVTVMELQYGALRLQRRDPRQGRILAEWVEGKVLKDFADRIIAVTTDVALVCAGLHVPDRRGERDAWIAATALVHDMAVVTRNVRDFEPTGVKVVNPWEAG